MNNVFNILKKENRSKEKMDFKSKSLPILRSPPFLACRIKTEADCVFQAFSVAPAQWVCRPTANWSTEGWHGSKIKKKKTNSRLVSIHLLPHSLPSPCCSLWCCLINLSSAPFGFSRPLCGASPLSTNKVLITALKAKAGFKEKFGNKHVRILSVSDSTVFG